MSKTRFMTALFSATESGDEELTNQVAGDINAAKRNGSFEDDEMSYEDLGDKGVLATDKMNGEQTLIHNEVSEDGTDQWVELSAYPEYCVGDYVHPEINPDGSQVVYAADEVPVENPREFSVATDNQAVLRIFSDQDMVETVAESVYQSEQEAQVGDLKFEKSSDNDGIIVTSLSSGDKAMVELDGPDMRVTELDQKNFKSFSNRSNMNVISRRSFSDEQYEPIFVVALDPVNKVLVNSPVYGEAAAQDLAGQLAELGLVGVNIFADPDEGRDYALALLCGEGVESADQIGEEEEAEVAYSDQSVICNRYFTDRTRFMNRMFAEAEEEITDHQDVIEDAIEHEEQIETEDYIITPVDEDTAVIEDKDSGEFTVAELDGEDINVEGISEEDAQDMIEDAEEHDYSDYLDYMQKMYREEWIGDKWVNSDDILKDKYRSNKFYETLADPRKNGGLTIEEQIRLNKMKDIANAKKGNLWLSGFEDFNNYKDYINTGDMKNVGKSRPGFKGNGSEGGKAAEGVFKKVGGLYKSNPKLAWGLTAAGALGTGGLGYAAYRRRQKNNSLVDQRDYTESRRVNGVFYDSSDNYLKTTPTYRSDKYYKDITDPRKNGGLTVEEQIKLNRMKDRIAAAKGDLVRDGFDDFGNLKEYVETGDMKNVGKSRPGATASRAAGGVDGAINWMVKQGKKLSKKDNAALKKMGNLIESNPKAALALTTAGAAAGVGGLGYGAYRMSQRNNSETRMFDDATLAQIEDQATEAIQNVQEAAETAINAIQQAKNEPVDNSSDIQEATYSDRMFSDCKSLDEVW